MYINLQPAALAEAMHLPTHWITHRGGAFIGMSWGRYTVVVVAQDGSKYFWLRQKRTVSNSTDLLLGATGSDHPAGKYTQCLRLRL